MQASAPGVCNSRHTISVGCSLIVFDNGDGSFTDVTSSKLANPTQGGGRPAFVLKGQLR
ncbi:MAG TPA: hypothetical protein VGK67_31775 [Myxococcales bacterium]